MNYPAPSLMSIEAIQPLAEKLAGLRDGQRQELANIAGWFGDPLHLARHYVAPDCQPHRPSGPSQADGVRIDLRRPLLSFIEEYLGRQARRPLFILADAGMGKTSALVMLKLTQLAGNWPNERGCQLLKLGADTLEKLEMCKDKAGTVLLLDALDEDPTALGRANERITELLQATVDFGQVIITCRPRYFPSNGSSRFDEPGHVVLDNFKCATLFLSPLNDSQVDAYLYKRFPDPWHQSHSHRRNPLRTRAKALLDTMGPLKSQPLVLSQIEWLMRAEKRTWNLYTVYEAWLEAWLTRERRKLGPSAPSMDELWEASAALAQRMPTMARCEIPETEFKALSAKYPGLAAFERLDLEGRSPLNRNSAGEYRFAHYGIKEFLRARSLPHSAAHNSTQTDPIPKTTPPKLPPQIIHVTDLVLDFLLTRDKDDVAPRDLLDLSGMSAESLAGLGFRDRMKDGRLGPAMVVIPGGRFFMGLQPGEAPDSSQEACVAPFALGRYTVSFSEYDVFAEATGREKPDDAGWGRGTRPAINVSWHDAQAYVAWLAEQTGEEYRLPTEVEWEYACRAGTTTHFYWGDSISPHLANYDSRFFYKGEAEERFRNKTLPVDEFAPNAFGLWQMHGNVWEWCEDTWHEQQPEATADGNGWSAPRVLRGGSWRDDAQTMRSAYRAWNHPHVWADFGGFRLARTLRL